MMVPILLFLPLFTVLKILLFYLNLGRLSGMIHNYTAREWEDPFLTRENGHTGSMKGKQKNKMQA